MLVLNTRQQDILELVKASGRHSIAELAVRFDVATQTIRKDINLLCDQGLVRRVHGGVVPPTNPTNLNFLTRATLNEDAKRAIGRKTAEMIPAGSSVLLGIGTTVQYVAEALLHHSDLTIVTNNLEVASMFCNADSAEVHFSGGTLRAEDRDVIGTPALLAFQSIFADFGVIGAGGLDPHLGVLDFKPFDADISRMIVDRARTKILVADHSKWQHSPEHIVTDFDKIDVMVTDKDGMPENNLNGLCKLMTAMDT